MSSAVSSQSSATAAAAAAANFSKGQDIELHELAKGWKAAISRAQDPSSRYVTSLFGNKKQYCIRIYIHVMILYTRVTHHKPLYYYIYTHTSFGQPKKDTKLA